MTTAQRLNALCLATLFAVITTNSFAADAADTADKAEAKTVSVFGEADLKVPTQFTATKPQSGIVEHEFVAKSEKNEDATARVTFMAAGGDVQANISRWKGQFSGGDPKAQKTKEMKVGKWNVHIVDVSGKFQERMGGGPFFGGKTVERENYAMTGAIIVHPEGRKYFVKMVGPSEVVTENRDAFVAMIKSIEK
ncbi:putative secreted protein [Rhodopirellula maiorica SM1]|uniref:Putative secreted protein n=1 Tax=Rhodopirellula maiorica SM1 TaxID=1265738 RepID=M5R8L4_9BACT|nr:hypothetical protein [Rhodopirellula maiorica]EMI15386.1 putative secreted protein [Rhodopirellula maiorica SM1]